MLPFFPQKRQSLCAMPRCYAIGKLEKTENARLFRCWDREQAGRHVEKWGENEFQKQRRYAIKNQVAGINHQKDPSKCWKRREIAIAFQKVGVKVRPNTCRHAEERRSAIKNTSRYAEEEKSHTQNASRYAEEERSAIQNAGRYAEEERNAIQKHRSLCREWGTKRKNPNSVKNRKRRSPCTGPRYAKFGEKRIERVMSRDAHDLLTDGWRSPVAEHLVQSTGPFSHTGNGKLLHTSGCWCATTPHGWFSS